MSAIATIEQDIRSLAPQFNKILVDQSINFEREAGFAIQILDGNDYALKVAMGNRQSVLNAVTNIAAIGISLNPAKKQAYLVPRKNKICLDISYIGLIDLAVKDQAIKWAKAELVYSSDSFVLHGAGSLPEHKFNPFAKERGDVVGVYCVAKTSDGDYLTECMSTDEVNAIRDRSESWKNGKSGPWKTDYGEMARKTVVKRASKYWSGNGRLEQAIHHLNTDGEEGLAVVVEDRHVPKALEGYDKFEETWLPKLEEAAKKGLKSYLEATQLIPVGAHRDLLGVNHHKRLASMARLVVDEGEPE